MRLVTTILTALVTGILAGALPSLLTSRRRRLLKLLSEEADVLDKVKDEMTRDDLIKAMQITSMRYSWTVADTQQKSAREHLIRFGPYLLALVPYGFIILRLAPRLSGDSETAQRAFEIVGGVVAVGAAAAFSILMLMMLDESRQNMNRKRALMRKSSKPDSGRS